MEAQAWLVDTGVPIVCKLLCEPTFVILLWLSCQVAPEPKDRNSSTGLLIPSIQLYKSSVYIYHTAIHSNEVQSLMGPLITVTWWWWAGSPLHRLSHIRLQNIHPNLHGVKTLWTHWQPSYVFRGYVQLYIHNDYTRCTIVVLSIIH